MKKTTLAANRVRHALFGSVGLVALALTTPAFAQSAGENPPDCPDENDDGRCDSEVTLSNADQSARTDDDTIVVTGSRIRRDEFSTTEPLTVITKDEVTQSGFNSAVDALQSTAATAGAQQINNYFSGFVTDGGTGANTLGLRNLGPARTLILLNGRRLAPAGTRGSLVAADLNVLPTSVVERIEILKAGASSVYGSDAIAGVVNIITDDQIRGLSLEGQVNIPEVGAGRDYRIAGTFGFGTDRLDIVGSIEYRNREGLERRAVDFFNCPVGGFLDGEGSEFGSADIPGFDGTTCFTLDNGGVTINTLGVSTRNGLDRVTGAAGRFNRFVPNAGNVTGPTPGFLGVTLNSRDTFDPQQEREYLVTPVEVLTGFMTATYDLQALGNAEAYIEALATRRKSSARLYRQLALDYPVYVTTDAAGNPVAFDSRINPLVPAQFRNSILAFPNETTGDGFVGARAFIGFGLTDSEQEVDYVRIGGGLRGDFSVIPDWRYNAYVGKSWTDGTYVTESFLTDRVAASTDVVVNAQGQVVCRTQSINPNCVAAPALNAATIGGNLPQAFRDYILQDVVGTTEFRETTYSLNVDGPIFTLPGGDVQLALGAEYREQSINDDPGEDATNGNLLGLTAGTPTIGEDAVKEVFGEIFVPILSDRPFFENLSLNGSVRYTDYDSYGSDVTYKIAGEWEFVRGFGVRGSYGTSYRAPALSEQFLGATSGFLGAGTDPCESDDFPQDANGNVDPSQFNGQQQIRAANCAAIGIDITNFTQTSGVTSFTRGGAETGLEAETSKNWTVGVVARPPIPASIGTLSLSLDYFDIQVDNGVSALGGGTIISRCYNEANFDPNAGFCRFVERDGNNAITVTSGFVNLSTDLVRGYEFNGRFAKDIFGGEFILNANVTKYTEQSTRLFPEEFLADANGTVTSPDWVGTFDGIFNTGPITLRYGLEWIDGDRDKTYRFFAFDNQTGEVDEELVQDYRDSFLLETADYFLHNASVQFRTNDNVEFTVGVRNIFNTAPPRITATGFSTVGNAPLYSGYDYIGRKFFMNVTAGF